MRGVGEPLLIEAKAEGLPDGEAAEFVLECYSASYTGAVR